MKILIILLSILISLTAQIDLLGRPEYSILQTYGTKCISCHVNPEGGGVRNSPGFLARNSISLIKPSWIGLEGFFNTIGSTNTYLNDKLLFGIDAREFSARFGSPTGSTRELMLMQCEPYLVVSPTKWLDIQGKYNFSYDIEDTKRFLGQEYWSASAIIKPGDNLPSLRVGYFQPMVGMLWDDHTVFTRQAVVAKIGGPLALPHEYAEWGAEINYSPVDYLELSVGTFSDENLEKTTVNPYKGTVSRPIVNKGNMSYTAKIGFYPKDIYGFTTFYGATAFYNGAIGFKNGIEPKGNYYYIYDLYLGFGMNDKFCILADYSTAESQHIFTTDNISVEANYQIIEPIILFVRGDRATTRQRNVNDAKDYYFNVNQFTFGTHVNVLPFIEFIPQYTTMKREYAPGYSAQWIMQIHLFY
jgi:hypothetical protein